VKKYPKKIRFILKTKKKWKNMEKRKNKLPMCQVGPWPNRPVRGTAGCAAARNGRTGWSIGAPVVERASTLVGFLWAKINQVPRICSPEERPLETSSSTGIKWPGISGSRKWMASNTNGLRERLDDSVIMSLTQF
jgi:hypothetical protein